jgi:hypothetical protein
MPGTIHDVETFTGTCLDCGKPIAAGRRCAPCGVKRLETPPDFKWRDDHGPACCCMSCVLERAKVRNGG